MAARARHATVTSRTEDEARSLSSSGQTKEELRSRTYASNGDAPMCATSKLEDDVSVSKDRQCTSLQNDTKACRLRRQNQSGSPD